MYNEHNKNISLKFQTIKKKNQSKGLFIISKSKLFSLFVCILTIAFSYFFSLYYVKGDQLLYTSFYNDVKGTNFLKAFVMYRNYLDASEPIYFIIVYLASNFISKNVFMALVNGVFMYFLSKLMMSYKISKLFILSLVFNFYFITLFLSLERLKFSLLFFVLFLYCFQKRKTRIFFLVLSLLSHAQTILLLISDYINRFLKSVVSVFSTFKIKKSPYIAIVLVLAALFLFFLQGHISRKIEYYIRGGLSISNIVKPVIFMLLTFFLYKRNFGKIFLMFLPFIFVSYVLGEKRVVIFTYFFFLYLSFKRSPHINIYIMIPSVYFIYRGLIFLNNILLYGDGYINF